MKPDLSSMTLAEAEAWRAGWRAARGQAVHICDAGARKYAAEGQADAYVLLWEYIADAIRAMEPPA